MKLIDPHDAVQCWPEWTDVLGQTIRPDDFVSYASINARSPQMVIAKVVRINRHRSNGTLIKEQVGEFRNRNHLKARPTRHLARLYTESCSFTVLPVLDARGFHRTPKQKAVTLHIPQNVLKVDWKPCDDHDPTR